MTMATDPGYAGFIVNEADKLAQELDTGASSTWPAELADLEATEVRTRLSLAANIEGWAVTYGAEHGDSLWCFLVAIDSREVDRDGDES